MDYFRFATLPDLNLINRQELLFNRSLNARDWPDPADCRLVAGGQWGVIRALNGQATTQPLTWAAEESWVALKRQAMPNRCLVPLLDPANGSVPLMAAGLLSLKNTIEANFFRLFGVGRDDDAPYKPFFVPEAHWQHWIEPSADVRDFIPRLSSAASYDLVS